MKLLVTIRSGFAKSKLPPCDFTPPVYTGKSYEQVLAQRKQYMPKFYFHYYKEPLLLHSGHRQYLFDHKGNRYLDLISGISTVGLGHSHPQVSRVIKDQCDKLIHTSPIYLGEYQGQYSKMICDELGGDYDSVYLCNSGGQANDMAVLLARLYSNNHKFLSLRNGYHGLVGNAGAITNVGTWNAPMVRGVDFEKLAWPNLYRGSHNTAEGLIRDAKEVLQANTSGKVSGFIFEPIQGVGGINPLPKEYVHEMFKLVKGHGGLTICDEVQTGFGRIGKDFWGHKWLGVKPDIITMAKGIGNGIPLAAVVTRREIADKLNFVFFNTFGGGYLQCRVGMEVLKALKKEKLHQNAETVGDYILNEFKKLQSKYQIVGDVRGKGLMIGMELVKNKTTKEPARQEVNQLMELTRQRSLLFGKGGALGNVMRVQPPLCLTMQDAKYLVGALDESLSLIK